jgi:hypothetical protein
MISSVVPLGLKGVVSILMFAGLFSLIGSRFARGKKDMPPILRVVSYFFFVSALLVLVFLPEPRLEPGPADPASSPKSIEITPRWAYSGMIGDWGGRDAEPCTAGATPSPALCGPKLVGKIAVCWDGVDFKNRSYPPGPLGASCQNQDQWCTYKDFSKVNLSTPPDGHAPGRVFSCAK